MKLHTYLIEAYDDACGYLQQVCHSISEQEAEKNFREICAERGEIFEVVEITLIGL